MIHNGRHYRSTREAANETGLTLRQLQHWDETGLVSAVRIAAPELGRWVRGYSAESIEKLLVIKELRKSHKTIRATLGLVKKQKNLNVLQRYAQQIKELRRIESQLLSA